LRNVWLEESIVAILGGSAGFACAATGQYKRSGDRCARACEPARTSEGITSSTCGYRHRLEKIQEPGVSGSYGGFSLDCFEIPRKPAWGAGKQSLYCGSDVRSIRTDDVLSCEKIIDVGHDATGTAQPLARTIRVQGT
jgi:hypothetical protein